MVSESPAQPLEVALVSSSAAGPCPDEVAITRFATGGGGGEERQRLEQHLDGCAECRAVVAVLAQTTPGATASEWEPDLQQVMSLQRLGEQYELEAPLGAGGMGVVVGARHRLLGHAVAIKVLRPSLALHPGTRQRFLVEAKAGARLTSAHVARVLDGGVTPEGLPFLVMERLEGADGERSLTIHGVPPISETLELVVQVLEALAEAHAIGLVHRDLKPANVFLSRRASGLHVKVLDFGLAKVLGEDLGLTASQGFLGSPLYVAPEQLRRSNDVDARADVWGVGCLLYRFLTGRVPFPASSVAEVVTRIQRDAPTPVHVLRPEVPQALSALVSQLLEKNPLQRPASVAEVGMRLRPFVTGATAMALDRLLRQAPAPIPPPLVAAAPRSSAALLVVGVLLGGLAGVGVGVLLPRGGPPSAAPASAERAPPRPAPERLVVVPGEVVETAPPPTQPAVLEPPSKSKRPVAASKPRPRADAGGPDAFEDRE